jgi:hypothetical protein
MATKKNGGATRHTEDRELQVKLTERELLQRGDEMAEQDINIEKLKLERSEYTSKINALGKRRNELAHTIERGTEARKVRCEWVEDFAKNVLRLKRLDTGEEVDTRPMTATDRQEDIFGGDDDGGEDAVPPPRSAKVKPISEVKKRRGPSPKQPNA